MYKKLLCSKLDLMLYEKLCQSEDKLAYDSAPSKKASINFNVYILQNKFIIAICITVVSILCVSQI